jgi:hypothetical protein
MTQFFHKVDILTKTLDSMFKELPEPVGKALSVGNMICWEMGNSCENLVNK